MPAMELIFGKATGLQPAALLKSETHYRYSSINLEL